MRAPGPRARTTVVLGIAFTLERLDEALLSAVYTPLGKTLHATPSQLGTLTLCRALVQVCLSWRLLCSRSGLKMSMCQSLSWALKTHWHFIK